MNRSDIGIIGLAVMGENLVLNMASKGFAVSVYNRSADKVKKFIEGRGKGQNITGTYSLEEFTGSLEKPRKVMMLVKAGKAVDDLIEQLLPLLDPDDIIIDGGNSHYTDTMRRAKYIEENKLLYIGTGVSGGEEGALTGPSIMPGGSPGAWPHVKNLFSSIAAKTKDGSICTGWLGSNGAGHFVKMVHNGIEYGDMQIISEAYYLMKNLLFMSHDEMHNVFTEWNEGELNSYLIKITADIMSFKDKDGSVLLEKILDKAGQKGTGKWTGITAHELGIPLTLIDEAVFARYLSVHKELRLKVSVVIKGPEARSPADISRFLKDLRDAVYAAKIISYTQGFDLMKEASRQYGWDLNYGDIAMLWREGCVIRSVFLDRIKEAYDKNMKPDNLLLDDFFREETEKTQEGWRRVVATAIVNGIPLPALSSALSYFDGIRSSVLPANLIQAQRDYFGAHNYERVDSPGGQFFHTNWSGRGGDTTSTSYNA